MKKYMLLAVILLVLIFLLYWFFVKEKTLSPEMSAEDRQALPADSATSDNSVPNDIPVFPNTPLGQQLEEHMMLLALPAETIEEADNKLAASLAELRKKPAEAVALLAEAYRKTEARHYFNRWEIVKTIGDVGDKAGTLPLMEIVLSAIPPETSKDLHHFSTQEEELVIRLRAVEGLGLLAAGGDRKAESLLLRIIADSSAGNNAIRLKAIKSYLHAGKDTDKRIAFLKSRLDKSWHELITVNTTSPEEFAGRMEAIKAVAPDSTKKEKYDRLSSPGPPPAVK